MRQSDKFAIIGGDIHKLVRLKEDSKISHAWIIHEKDDLYWVPIEDQKSKNEKGEWIWRPYEAEQCQACLKRWYSKARAEL